MNMNINFPHLGIELEHVGRSISILGFHITYYGILIGLALVAGIFITIYFAVKSRQNIEHYLDLVIWDGALGCCRGKTLLCSVFVGQVSRTFLSYFQFEAGRTCILWCLDGSGTFYSFLCETEAGKTDASVRYGNCWSDCRTDYRAIR